MKSKYKMVGKVLLCFIFTASNLYAAGHKYGLIVVQLNVDSDGVARTNTLVRYHFDNGVLVKTENIYSSDIRFDIGENQIYDGKYLLSDRGDVVDLTFNKLLFKSKGELVGIDKKSNKIVIKVDRVDDQGIYTFDLSSHQYQRIRKPGLWAISGTTNPDGQYVASGDGTTIRLHYSKGKIIVLGTDFGRYGTLECNSFQTPSFIWIDDTHLLTMRGNGHLVIVDVKGHVEPLVTIPDEDPPACGPELRKDTGNNIIYDGGINSWHIDLAKRSFEPYLWESEGNDFEINYPNFDPKGQLIRYRGTEIARWQRDIFESVSAPGHIAVTSGPLGAHMGGINDELNVWSADNGQWTTIKNVWIASIVGWLEE